MSSHRSFKLSSRNRPFFKGGDSRVRFLPPTDPRDQQPQYFSQENQHQDETYDRQMYKPPPYYKNIREEYATDNSDDMSYESDDNNLFQRPLSTFNSMHSQSPPQPQVAQPQPSVVHTQSQVVAPVAQPQPQPQVAPQPQVMASPQVAQPQVVAPVAQPQVVTQVMAPPQPQVAQPQVAQPQVAQPQVAQPQVEQPQPQVVSQEVQPPVVQSQVVAQPQVVSQVAPQPQETKENDSDASVNDEDESDEDESDEDTISPPKPVSNQNEKNIIGGSSDKQAKERKDFYVSAFISSLVAMGLYCVSEKYPEGPWGRDFSNEISRMKSVSRDKKIKKKIKNNNNLITKNNTPNPIRKVEKREAISEIEKAEFKQQAALQQERQACGLENLANARPAHKRLVAYNSTRRYTLTQ